VSGDWLLIFSDGIREATDEHGEEFGDDGLLKLSAGWETEPPPKYAAA
jgi:serine phosphatase RsbU (regulator of sigma subunit)